MPNITQGRWRSSLTELSIYFVTWLKSHALPPRKNSNKPDVVAAGSKLPLIVFKCLLLETINLNAYQVPDRWNIPYKAAPYPSTNWYVVKRKPHTYLAICVLVNFIIPRVVIMLNESKIFLLLSLQCGWSPVNVGRKITLEEQKKHRHPWLLCIKSVKNKWSLPEWPRHMEIHLREGRALRKSCPHRTKRQDSTQHQHPHQCHQPGLNHHSHPPKVIWWHLDCMLS